MTKTPKPFRIDAPGLYLTRDGRTVEVERRGYAKSHPWCGSDNLTRRADGGFSPRLEDGTHRYDIVAKAPARPTSKAPRPAKGKKAKRRYFSRAEDGSYSVFEQDRSAWLTVNIATGMSRADARAFAAMKEAQRGGA